MVTLPSSASTSPVGVSASGLTSTSVASSSTSTRHSRSRMKATCALTASGKRAASTISAAFSGVQPSRASTRIIASSSGRVAATSSMSMPPATLAIARYVRLARSSRNET